MSAAELIKYFVEMRRDLRPRGIVVLCDIFGVQNSPSALIQPLADFLRRYHEFLTRSTS
jgi:hypothetical protein